MDLIVTFPFLVTQCTLPWTDRPQVVVLPGQGLVVASSQMSLVLNFLIINSPIFTVQQRKGEKKSPECRLSKFVQFDCLHPFSPTYLHLASLCTFALLCTFTWLHFASFLHFTSPHPAVLLFYQLQTPCYCAQKLSLTP